MTASSPKILKGINSSTEFQQFVQKLLTHSSTITRQGNEAHEQMLTKTNAQNALEEFVQQENVTFVPFSILRAVQSWILQLQTTAIEKEHKADSTRSSSFSLMDEFERILQHHAKSLVFVPVDESSPSYYYPDDTRTEEEKKKHHQRMERLRILVEENNYRRITSNIEKKVQDDATMKSMMYATSIGLNMIVAPLSFGAFMYFFSGAVFERFFQSSSVHSTGSRLDIRRVIVAVISGVIMLFIEMILFVIRNHEMDSSIRKKSKIMKENPFGYNKIRAKKTFT